MTEMAAAAGTGDFVALAVGVFADRDVASRDHLIKARPTGAGFKLVFTAEQIELATGANVRAGLVVVEEFILKRRLGALLPQDVILHRRERFLPIGVGLFNATDRVATGR